MTPEDVIANSRATLQEDRDYWRMETVKLQSELDKKNLQISEFREECTRARIAWKSPKMDSSHTSLFIALMDKWGKGPIHGRCGATHPLYPKVGGCDKEPGHDGMHSVPSVILWD